MFSRLDKMKSLGVYKHKLKVIDNTNGKIMHAMKKSDFGYQDFGEVYFSHVKYKKIKAWKRHTKMTMNLVVPIGSVRFVFFDEDKKKFKEYKIGENEYCRLTVDPLIWFGFQGIKRGKNLVMNISNIEHEADEVQRKDLIDLEYLW